jgi:NAD(P)-dependent dehydrogenase (short-subunit alcohol dehydrogenase family)
MDSIGLLEKCMEQGRTQQSIGAGKLTGQVVLITGAGRKRDIAVAAPWRDPATFPAHERSENWRGIASLADEIRAFGRRAVAIECDVTSSSELEAMIARIIAELGEITGVVNCAGVASDAGAAPIVDMDDALWHHTIAVNLAGVYLVSKFAARDAQGETRWCDRQSLVARWTRRHAQLWCLLCDQVRSDRANPADGARTCRAGNSRELRVPRFN